MELSTVIISAIILFGSGFALVMAAGQFMLRFRTANNYLLAAFFMLVTVWQFLGGIGFLGLYSRLGINVYAVSVPCYFLTIPLIYLYFQCLLDSGFRFQPVHALHFAAPLASFLVLLPLTGIKIDLYSAMSFTGHGPHSRPEMVLSTVMYLSTITYLAYLAVLIFKIERLRTRALPGSRRPIILTQMMVFFMVAINIFWLADRVFTLNLPHVPYICVTVVLVAIYLLSNRYPEYLLIMSQEAERARYTRTRISHLDTEGILTGINRIMEEEEAFRDEKMSLTLLAGRLDITPHQLSEVINTCLHTNFFNLVNSYRIETAKRILLNNPDRKVLAVALDVGFNSTSAFYNSFNKIVGTSPTRYRENGVSIPGK